MIIRRDDIEAAVEHGVISAQAARDLTEFTLQRSKAPRAMNEHFRLFSNFSEVFICLGLVILFSALNAMSDPASTSPIFTIAIALVFWAFAEFFTIRTTKMAPALFSVVFAGYLATKAFTYIAGISTQYMFSFEQGSGSTIMAFGAVFTLVAFARFKIPALLAILVVTSAAAGVLFAGKLFGSFTFLWPLGICGVAALTAAIWFDSRDPLRRSRQNAYAFWLFIIGSPLAIHPLFASVWLQSVGEEMSLTVIAVVFILATIATIIGLLLDRRSLVASSLIYFTVSIGYFNYTLTGDGAIAFAYTPLLVGTFVIVIGVLWYKARSGLLKIIPLGKFKAYLPPSH